jgi:hypothetical protein
MRTLGIRVPTCPGYVMEYTFHPERRTVCKKGLTAAGLEYKGAVEYTLKESEIMRFLANGPKELKLWLEGVGFTYEGCRAKLMAEQGRTRPRRWRF